MQHTLGFTRELLYRNPIEQVTAAARWLEKRLLQAYLKNWQIDALKIDKSFIRDLAPDSSDYAIVSAIIAIARHLHIDVIAEGVEAYRQADILRNLHCPQAQGFLFARPMSADRCLATLRKPPLLGYSDDDMLPEFALHQ